MTDQPTHHGYAVCVKVPNLSLDLNGLSDDQVRAEEEFWAEEFWAQAQDIGRRHGFAHVYSEGRMSGWAVPDPQPEFYSEEEGAEWLRDVFLPFAADIEEAVAEAVANFTDGIEILRTRAEAEPAEAAYWAACDVITR